MRKALRKWSTGEILAPDSCELRRAVSKVAARIHTRLWGSASDPVIDVDEVRQLRTRRAMQVMLLVSTTIFIVVGLTVLSGPQFGVMLSWGLGYALLATASLPLLRSSRVRAAKLLVNGGLTLLFALVPVLFDALPPGAPLALMLMILAASFVESAREVMMVYLATVACLTSWTLAELPTYSSRAEILFPFGFLTVACGIAMVGASRYSIAMRELSRGIFEREQLNAQVMANNELLESAVAQRTVELEQMITEKDELLQVLAKQAVTDDLTGLMNRAGFRSVLQSLSGGESGSTWIAMLDLDGLKAWNDTYGHLLGDEVLRGVGRALQAVAGDKVHAARLSGDEFALLFQRSSGEQVASVCWSLVESVDNSRDLPIGDVVRSPGISIGLAVFDLADPSGSVMRADRALYEAKRTGGRRVAIATETRSRSSGDPAPDVVLPSQVARHVIERDAWIGTVS